MPYTINRYNGDTAVVVADGTVDNTFAVKLIGKNYAGYGEIQNENFLALLENFANGTEPPRKTAGQLWYDSSKKKLKFYDGGKFKNTGGAEISDTEPLGLTEGDLWWKPTTKQLFSKNAGTGFTLVGPQAAGSNQTEMFSRTVVDKNEPPQTHAIIEARVDGKTAFIISPDAVFELDTAVNDITGFKWVHPGITLAYTTDSSSSTDIESTGSIKLFGTATNADNLGGSPASSFVQNTGTPTFSARVKFSDLGYTVGDTWGTNGLLVEINSGTPRVQAQSDTLNIQTKISGNIRTPLKLVGTSIVNGNADGDGVSYNIGSPGALFNNVYANTFIGEATKATTLSVGGVFRSAAVDAPGLGTANTIAVRDGSGNINAVLFQGQATAAQYADLAEKYLADREYETGTVLMVGGEKEVTAAQVGFRAIGVVSANPAYMMNSELEGGTYVALKGRVPVKVYGNVMKGQRLVAGQDGTAQIAFGAHADVFAIALETNTNPGLKLVEAVIL